MTIIFKRGHENQLPKQAADRELLVTTDTHLVFMGQGPSLPLKPLLTVAEIAAVLAEGVTIFRG